jgi:hypothetical protein
MRLWCMSKDDNMIHPTSFSVKRSSRPTEEHRPKKLWDESVPASPVLGGASLPEILPLTII